MSARPWYKRFGADFVFGTMGLTLEERGAYSIIIDLIHDRGKAIPDDARFMAGILGVSTRKWRAIRDALIGHGKIYEADGFLSNERCDADLAEAYEQARKQAESGAKGGRKRAENALNSERNEREPQKKPNEINESGQATLKPARSQKPDKKEDTPPVSPPKGGDSKRKTPGRMTAIPDNWILPEEGWDYARKKGWSDGEIREGAEHFAAHHGAKGSRFKDWHKAWTTWVLNKRRFGRTRSRPGGDTDPYLDAARDVIARDPQGRSAGKTGEAGGLLALLENGSDGPAQGSLGNVIELQPSRSGGAVWGDDGPAEPVEGHAGEGEGAGQCVFAAAFRLPGGGG